MHAEDDIVDTLRRALREASDRVDDAPDARVRAAVLAAAARGVDARPRLASAPGSAPSATASGPRPSRPRRWPWSAAALLVVSVTTGLLAARFVQDRPERITTIASSGPAVPIAPAATPGTAAKPPSEPSPAMQAPEAPAPAHPPAAVRRRPEAPRDDARRAPRPAAVAKQEDRPAQAATAAPAGPAVAPAPAPTPEVLAKARPSADAQATLANPTQERADPTPPRSPAASPLIVATATRARIGRTAEPTSPQSWVERIVKLRADGHDIEADRELDALRQRYPDFDVPATALRSTDTR